MSEINISKIGDQGIYLQYQFTTRKIKSTSFLISIYLSIFLSICPSIYLYLHIQIQSNVCIYILYTVILMYICIYCLLRKLSSYYFLSETLFLKSHYKEIQIGILCKWNNDNIYIKSPGMRMSLASSLRTTAILFYSDHHCHSPQK